MSDYSNPFETKPIDKVKNEVHQINRNLNKLKTDVICIKSDLSIIKEFIKQKEKEAEEKKDISTGWFW